MTAAVIRQSRVAQRSRALPLALAALALFAACYAGGPFVTLWRINRAVGNGDLDTLRGAIDWNAVRQGLKDDTAEGLLGMPRHALEVSNTLPPFGASFVSGIAAAAVDRDVTPQGLVHAARLLDAQPGPGVAAPFPAIVGARFASPARFDVSLRVPGQDANEEPLHLRLTFQAGGWRLMRVWIPQDLMDRAADHG
jgi:hypothetical protein